MQALLVNSVAEIATLKMLSVFFSILEHGRLASYQQSPSEPQLQSQVHYLGNFAIYFRLIAVCFTLLHETAFFQSRFPLRDIKFAGKEVAS